MLTTTRFPQKVALLITLFRLGPKSLSLVSKHKWNLKRGKYLAQTPLSSWSSSSSFSGESPFQVPELGRIREAMLDPQHALERGNEVLRGEISYFSGERYKMPSDWNQHPVSKHKALTGHWIETTKPGAVEGDVKWYWEPSRFDWLIDLLRAWSASGSDRYPQHFWQLLQSWREHNPPNFGINWQCGQEASYRLFALVFAAGILQDSPTCTSENRGQLWQTIQALACRIETTLGYALGQRNNHAIAESGALWIAGLTMPDHPKSSSWRAFGEKHFVDQLRHQTGPDGSMPLHSVNYQRVVLMDCLLTFLTVERLGGSSNLEEIRQLTLRAADWLARLTSGVTGAAPNYGPNDGSNPFALHGLGFHDYRPVCQTVALLLSGQRYFPPGPWDEMSRWFGINPDEISEIRTLQDNPETGYHQLSSGRWSAFFRAGSYTTRPFQADMFEVDVLIDGRLQTIDGGTYNYSDLTGTSKILESSAGHNTVTINASDQMRKVGKFLWLDWIQVKMVRKSTHEVEAEHSNYPGVKHCRRVKVMERGVLVFDTITSAPVNSVELRWHLHPAASLKPLVRSTHAVSVVEREFPHSLTYGNLGKHEALEYSASTGSGDLGDGIVKFLTVWTDDSTDWWQSEAEKFGISASVASDVAQLDSPILDENSQVVAATTDPVHHSDPDSTSS